MIVKLSSILIDFEQDTRSSELSKYLGVFWIIATLRREPTVQKLNAVPGARFPKAPETFRTRKAIFSSSGSKIREWYAPETSCVMETPVKKQLYGFPDEKKFWDLREKGPYSIIHQVS